MDRRSFIAGAAAGVAAAAVPHRGAFGRERAPRHVAVIGAGIVGSAIAWHLARRGCRVTLVERRHPASQASGNTFAWINAAWASRPDSYRRLRQASLDEYRWLRERVDFPIRWSGSLEWFEDPASQRQLVRDVTAFRPAAGSPTRLVTGDEVAAIEPGLVVDGASPLAHSTNDGTVDAAATTRALFDAALALGAEAVMPAHVSALEERSDGVEIVSTAGRFHADVAVIAAGVGTAAVARSIGESADSATATTPGIIVTSVPMPRMVNTVLYPPRVHIHQRDDGRIVLGEKPGAPSTNVHTTGLAARPNEFPDMDLAREHALRILRAAQDYVPALADVTGFETGIGWRPMPADGLPIVGFLPGSPGVYVATMHSGVTLAPVIGRSAAREILDGERVSALDEFRPGRGPAAG